MGQERGAPSRQPFPHPLARPGPHSRVAHLLQHSGQGLCLQEKLSLTGPGVGKNLGKG